MLKAGAFVSLSHDGFVQIDRGFIRREDETAASRATNDDDRTDEDEIAEPDAFGRDIANPVAAEEDQRRLARPAEDRTPAYRSLACVTRSRTIMVMPILPFCTPSPYSSFTATRIEPLFRSAQGIISPRRFRGLATSRQPRRSSADTKAGKKPCPSVKAICGISSPPSITTGARGSLLIAPASPSTPFTSRMPAFHIVCVMVISSQPQSVLT